MKPASASCWGTEDPEGYTQGVATSALSKVTLAERPDLTDALRESGLDGALSWPRFYEGNAVNKLYWDRLYKDFAGYQVLFVEADDSIVALTKVSARELARKNITANAIAPGVVDTESSA